MTNHKYSGFTLIEAMVSVLVISIGFLGLASLQSRLWSASSLLHSTSQAYMLASSQLEQAQTPWVTTRSIINRASSTIFTHNLMTTSVEKLNRHEVSVRWDIQSGQQLVELNSYSFTTDLVDTRWLLYPR